MIKRKFLVLQVLLFVSVCYTQTQDYHLHIKSDQKTEVDLPSYQKRFNDTLLLNKEVQNYAIKLEQMGFFNQKLVGFTRKQNDYHAYFSLGKRIMKASLYMDKAHQHFLPASIKIKKDTVFLETARIKSFLQAITHNLEKEGQSFAKINLTQLSIKNDVLYGSILITTAKTRSIDSLIVRGYKDFPKKFIKQYLLDPKEKFSQLALERISKRVNTLSFVTETKFPEALFTKDSTKVYLYLKRKENSSIDANINFTGSESDQIQFNGLVDLSLHNVFNKGSRLSLFWNAAGNQREQLQFSATVPYIYGSKFTPSLNFSLFKQDSTFVNTKFDVSIAYPIHPTLNIGVNYSTASSNNLETTRSNIKAFTNSFFGISTHYLQPNGNTLFPKKLEANLQVSFGTRVTETMSSNQFKFNFDLSYLWELNSRNFIAITNNTGLLNSDSFVDNELFRIGGMNSIRGFNDQSIFTDRYSATNIEYRFVTNASAYFYTITDYANARVNLKFTSFLGLGLGYHFTIKNSQFNIAAALGKTEHQNFNFSDTQLIVRWKNFF